MPTLLLHEFHAARGASFRTIQGAEVVAHYGTIPSEYEALTRRAAVVDLSFRGRICLLGADREKFLHGQVTNDILKLRPGQGCYAAIVNAKAKMESDLYIFKLADEILLDFEPGLTGRITDRLNRYIIADDVQVVDVAPHYGLLHVSGPAAREVLSPAGWPAPEQPLGWASVSREEGEVYIANNPRYGVAGFDLFIPTSLLASVAASLESAWAGFEATEIVRIEHGIPRYGADMSETTLPQEAELQDRAISFAKGCYIGQEIIARIRTYGQVAKALRLLRVSGTATPVPEGAPVYAEGKNVGAVTSSTFSPVYQSVVALTYVRKEYFAPGTRLRIGEPPLAAEVVR